MIFRIVTAVVLLLAVQAVAQLPITYPPPIEAAAKELEMELIAPCCWTQPIAEHKSGIAEEMKAEIRKMLSDGKTKQAILDFYVQKDGMRVLSIPRQEGFNRLSYLMPIVFMVIGLVIVGFFIRKWKHSQQAQTATANPTNALLPEAGLDPVMSARIEREISEMK